MRVRSVVRKGVRKAMPSRKGSTRRAPAKATSRTSAPAAEAPAVSAHRKQPTKYDYARHAWRTLQQGLFRYRQQLWPLAFLVAGMVAGTAVSGQSPGRAVVLAALAAAVVGWRMRRVLGKRRTQIEVGVCAVLGTGWLVSAAVLGFAAVDVVGVALWAVVSVMWWKRHPPVIGASAKRSSHQELWTDNVSGRISTLSGVELLSPKPFEHGWTYALQLVPGVQHLGTVQQQLPMIASGLRLPMDELIVEQDPDYKDPTRLRMQIITKSPIRETVWFDKPSLMDGRITLGPYADGIGNASYRLYTRNSMWGGYILGGTGSGKSIDLETIGLAAKWSGETVLIYVDGQDGASSPTLYRHATWSAGPEEAETVLVALERAMQIRQKYNRVEGLAGFNPSSSYPGILIVVDEAHRVFHSGTAKRWAGVAREGRKVGMAVLGASQYSSLEDTFGGSEALRSSLLAGNAFAKRTSSRIAAQMMPGLELNPAQLPALPGFGYAVQPPDDPEARSAPYRTRYMPDEQDRARDGQLPVPTREEWFARAAEESWEPELDGMTARAMGPEFTDRHERAEQRRHALEAEIAGSVPREAEEPAPTRQSKEPTGGQYGELVMALPWERYDFIMKRQDMFSELPEGWKNPSSLAAALRSLSGDGGPLIAKGGGVYALARAPERVA